MAKLEIGDRAIGFELPNVRNGSVSLDDYSDQEAVVVLFTCNHCPYVQAWEDRLVQIANDYSDRGVEFAAINANDAEKYPADSPDAMRQRAEEKKYPFPYLYDESQEVARAYGAERTPEVFLFDTAGNLRYHGAPDDNYEASQMETPYLRDALDAVLAGEDVPLAQTSPVGCTIKWK
ncbi:MAG: Thiol-disulfide oxidoreductase ResA [Anaerolineales bacterium]|nr:Thiol-disulfide oxidoreductase ResA [Anaerolineales bacterium]